MRRADEYERQHANPCDLVDEGGDGGAETDREKQVDRRGCFVLPVPVRHYELNTFRGRGRASEPPQQAQTNEDARRGDEVQNGGRRERSGQANPRQEYEAGNEHTDRCTEAVGEIEKSENTSGAGPKQPDCTRAHERKGRSE